LVQARVPAELYKRIERNAKQELISVAAYVRRTLQNYVPGG
jgi:predicted HicB family RNase H-like nuclease